jgi:glycosyltransferase involved in cell wall biosynthesis
MKKLELVLPAYNESASLAFLIERASRSAASIGLTSDSFRLLIVNNGSTDSSAEILRDLKNGPLGPWFEVVDVKVNQGYGFGLWSGLKNAKAEIVAWSHADQQCDPIDVMRGFERLIAQPNKRLIIKGVRRDRSRKDIFVSRVFETFAFILLGLRVYEINAQPKVFYRDALDQITNPPRTFAFDLYFLFRTIKAGYVLETLPVSFPPRVHGASRWAANFFSRYKTILGMIAYMWRLARQDGRA